MQDELANPKGRSWSEAEGALLLTLIIGVMLHSNEAPTAALRFVATTTRRSYDSLYELWKHWSEERLVYVIDTANRGAGSVYHVHHAHHVTVDVLFTTIEFIREANITGAGCTSIDIQRCIRKEHALHIPSRTLKDVLASMGYRYGRGNVIGKMNDAWYVARIRTFLIQYGKAVVEQLQGRCVIVYTDESYVNVNHARQFTWYNPGAPERNDVVRPSGRGKRLVLLHAFTEHGWLALDPTVHNDRVDQKVLSCEVIYEAEKADGDYHKNMNGDIYMQWLNNRLLPVFAERFPGQKMVLVLDNASYHHPRGPDWINVHRLNKAQLASKLIEFGVTSVTVRRAKKGTTAMQSFAFEASTFQLHGGPYAPTREELKEELRSYLATHPGTNRTEVCKLMEQHQHQLIYTPPYLPAVQPIERLWGYIKNYVARQFKAGRTLRELHQQTYQGFYGDGNGHEGVDARLAASVILHSHKSCNFLIEEDDALKGTIDNLSTEVSAVPIDVEQDIEAEMDPFPGVEDEDEE